jgi:hypothetical protein
MDFSKYIEMRAQASMNYKSYWQPRDASEVTRRNGALAAAANKSTHQGPESNCCSDNKPQNARSSSPINGFSTNYSLEIVTGKQSGCTQCQDETWGKAGGVNTLTCSEIVTILTPPPNPVKTTTCYCADPGVPFHQVYPPQPIPSYSGWYNQTPTNPQPSSFLQAVTLPSG